MSAREQILSALRSARGRRAPVEHPGAFGAWRPTTPPSVREGFEAMFTQAGGEVVHVADAQERDAWLRTFLAPFGAISLGAGVPPEIVELVGSTVERGLEHTAAVGVACARTAVAETGSLVMDARDGRRAQLLPPVLVVLVEAAGIHGTLGEALAAVEQDLSAAIGLHSGPSKSADIGQVMVKGVHGPGRVIAVVL